MLWTCSANAAAPQRVTHIRRRCENRPVLELRQADPATPPGSDLLAAMVAEMDELYEIGALEGAPASPADMSPPGGAFVVLWEADEPVACGGLKRLDASTCEIKRMYVVPAARSRGVARRLLAGLEDTARSLGYAVVRLDTGPRQPHARALYESAGYRSIHDYNGNPAAAHWFEKSLVYR